VEGGTGQTWRWPLRWRWWGRGSLGGAVAVGGARSHGCEGRGGVAQMRWAQGRAAGRDGRIRSWWDPQGVEEEKGGNKSL
jgi:hypothetical protein